jgi:hypothetical protein
VVFAGTSGQGRLLVVETDAARTRIVHVNIGWEGRCSVPSLGPGSADRRFWRLSLIVRSRIGPRGEWRAAGVLLQPARDPYRIVRRLTYSVQGRSVNGRMTGTIRSSRTDTGGGQALLSCSSAPVRFSIANRNVFAGSTAEQQPPNTQFDGTDLPIVATFDAARRRLLRVAWEWQHMDLLAVEPRSPYCSFFPGFDLVDAAVAHGVVTNVPVSRSGRFGVREVVGKPVLGPPNETSTQTVSIDGVVTGGRLHGSLRMRILSGVPGGFDRARCATGNIAYRARD